MIDCIEILIVLSFMAVCMHGAYLIIKDKENNNED